VHSTTTLALAFAIAATATTAQAQSTVRPVPRIPRPLDWSVAEASAARPNTNTTAPSAHERLEALLPDEARREVDLEVHGTLLPAAGLETGVGEVQTQRFGWRGALLQELDGGSVVALSVANEATFYDFGDTAALIGSSSDPLNDVYETRLGATYYGPLGERLSYYHGLEFVVAGDPEAGLRESTTLGLTSGIAYRAADSLEVTLGLFAFSRLEDDAVVMPYIGLEWEVLDGIALRAEGNRVALAAELGDTLDLELFALYAQRQFRLDEAGGVDEPVFRDEQIDLGATLAIGIGEGASLELGVGYTAWRELTFLAGGSTQSEVELDPKPFASLGLTFGL
jgi:hypothetical protein